MMFNHDPFVNVLLILFVILMILIAAIIGFNKAVSSVRQDLAHLYHDCPRGDKVREALGMHMEWSTPQNPGLEMARVVSGWKEYGA